MRFAPDLPMNGLVWPRYFDSFNKETNIQSFICSLTLLSTYSVTGPGLAWWWGGNCWQSLDHPRCCWLGTFPILTLGWTTGQCAWADPSAPLFLSTPPWDSGSCRVESALLPWTYPCSLQTPAGVTRGNPTWFGNLCARAHRPLAFSPATKGLHLDKSSYGAEPTHHTGQQASLTLTCFLLAGRQEIAGIFLQPSCQLPCGQREGVTSEGFLWTDPHSLLEGRRPSPQHSCGF